MQAASDTLGEIPPGFAALQGQGQGQLQQAQPTPSVARQGADSKAKPSRAAANSLMQGDADQAPSDVPPGYHVRQPSVAQPTVSSLAGTLLIACTFVH